MYQTARKIAGEWVILLDGATKQYPGVIQFRNLSRSAALAWRAINEPLPVQSQLNATAGKAVWRDRRN